MQPTEILFAEHRIIEQVLACLEKLAEKAADGQDLDRSSARDAIYFFRDFADRCHHGKEEAHLFPIMEAAGFPPHGGPTAVMRAEHDEGRAHVRAMAKALGLLDSEPGALRLFVDHARAYVMLLRQHIAKEDECLFPMANDALEERQQRNLMAVFEKVDSEERAKGTHERCLKTASDLAERFGIEKAAIPDYYRCPPRTRDQQ